MRDEEYMSLALQLAESARGQTSPNPAVGAVVVKDGVIAGMGAHLRAGEAHAEVHALQMAGDRARGGTIYVTLEPCSHHGRTPPCTDAIRQAGIRRAVVAVRDPNPLVAGRGIHRLQQDGIEVTEGVLEEQARRLNEVFFHYITTRTPFVILKTASTLDGKIASATGDSKWVTGELARQEVHRLRHQADAILVGVNTVIADDPSLTARLQPEGKQPLRLVLDRTLRIQLHARVLHDGCAPTWVVTTKRAPKAKADALRERGAKVVELAGGTSGEQIRELLARLGEREITSLLVEGGGEINAAFLQAQAVQKVIAYISCRLIGGKNAPTPFDGQGFIRMDQAVELSRVSIHRVSELDLRIEGYPHWPKGPQA